MAGPREAVWHAVIRRNHGCTHFIVGRDHAGPSYKTKDGKSFYEPLAAQQLAKSMEDQIRITIITSEEVVYCDDIQSMLTMSLAVTGGHDVKNISGTQFRSMLEKGEDVPEWFSYPEVLVPLRAFYQRPKGHCVYFVGLSGAGKSTLAQRLRARIQEEAPHKEVTILDADEIRRHLSKGLGFSKVDRSTNVRRIGYVASEIVRHGGVVLVANIAPYEEDRQYNRSLVSAYGTYTEVFVDTTIDECERRDVKGLYAKARRGELKNFTGRQVEAAAKAGAIEFISSPPRAYTGRPAPRARLPNAGHPKGEASGWVVVACTGETKAKSAPIARARASSE
jgi:sulfate adenylyltransferase